MDEGGIDGCGGGADEGCGGGEVVGVGEGCGGEAC